jgi:hypothetical protein
MIRKCSQPFKRTLLLLSCYLLSASTVLAQGNIKPTSAPHSIDHVQQKIHFTLPSHISWKLASNNEYLGGTIVKIYIPKKEHIRSSPQSFNEIFSKNFPRQPNTVQSFAHNIQKERKNACGTMNFKTLSASQSELIFKTLATRCGNSDLTGVTKIMKGRDGFYVLEYTANATSVSTQDQDAGMLTVKQSTLR